MQIVRDPTQPLFLYAKGSQEELSLVAEGLTFVDRKEQQRYQRALQNPDLNYTPIAPPITTFFDRDENRFFVGHLGILLSFLAIRQVPVTLPSELAEHTQKIHLLPGIIQKKIQSRDYQLEAIETGIRKRHGIIKAGTGAGKSIISAGLLHNLPGPALYLTQQSNLCHLVLNEFREAGLLDLGLIADGVTTLAPVVVSEPKYLARIMKRNRDVRQWLKTIRTIIVDECQGVGAASCNAVVMATAQAEFRFGLSGTPFQHRTVGESLRDVQTLGVFGDIIYEVPVADLIEQGYLAKPKLYMIPMENPKVQTDSRSRWRAKNSPGGAGIEFAQIYRDGVVKHENRNKLASQVLYVLAKLRKMQTLVLVQQVQHGQTILENLTAMGIDAVFVKGAKEVYFPDNPRSAQKDKMVGSRLRAVTQFADREFQVMIGTVGTFGVGYDLPGDMVEAMVLLAGGRGLIPVLQRLGRALRPKPDGSDVVVVDFDDKTHFYLTAQANKRRSEYMAEGHTVEGWIEFQRDLILPKTPPPEG